MWIGGWRRCRARIGSWLCICVASGYPFTCFLCHQGPPVKVVSNALTPFKHQIGKLTAKKKFTASATPGFGEDEKEGVSTREKCKDSYAAGAARTLLVLLHAQATDRRLRKLAKYGRSDVWPQKIHRPEQVGGAFQYYLTVVRVGCAGLFGSCLGFYSAL